MGVVVKQSLWGTLIAYTGVVVGYVNTLYFRAEYLSLDQIGLFTLITANAMMISPLASLGAGASYMKFFPWFDERGKGRFFSYLFLIAFLGNAAIILLCFFFKDAIAERYADQSRTYVDYLFVTGIVIVANSLFDLLFSYSRSILKVITPSFLRDVYLRLGTLTLIIGYSADWWSFEGAVIGLGVIYAFAFTILLLHLIFLHGLTFDFRIGGIHAEWRGKIVRFGGYSMLLAGSFAIINNISYEQITATLGFDLMGVFSTCFFIGVVVEMPKRNMAKVMMPFISQAFEKKDTLTIENIYKRSSITMSVVGVLFTIGIITNLQDLFDFIPKGSDFQTGFWVVIFVCLAKVVLMVSSFAGEIINYSDRYLYNLYFQLLTAGLLIVLNYFLIPLWGINGAGFSYMASIFFHILLKGWFVKSVLHISPFCKTHLPLLLISGLVFGMAYLFQPDFHPIVNIAMRSFFTTLIFLVAVYQFKISNDINTLIRHTFGRFLNIKLK